MDIYNRNMENFQNSCSELEDPKYAQAIKRDMEQTIVATNDLNHDPTSNNSTTHTFKNSLLNKSLYNNTEDSHISNSNHIHKESESEYNNCSNSQINNSDDHEEKFSVNEKSHFRTDESIINNSINKTEETDEVNSAVKIENVKDKISINLNSNITTCKKEIKTEDLYDDDTEEDEGTSNDHKLTEKDRSSIIRSSSFIKKCLIDEPGTHEESTSSKLSNTIKKCHIDDCSEEKKFKSNNATNFDHILSTFNSNNNGSLHDDSPNRDEDKIAMNTNNILNIYPKNEISGEDLGDSLTCEQVNDDEEEEDDEDDDEEEDDEDDADTDVNDNDEMKRMNQQTDENEQFKFKNGDEYADNNNSNTNSNVNCLNNGSSFSEQFNVNFEKGGRNNDNFNIDNINNMCSNYSNSEHFQPAYPDFSQELNNALGNKSAHNNNNNNNNNNENNNNNNNEHNNEQNDNTDNNSNNIRNNKPKKRKKKKVKEENDGGGDDNDGGGDDNDGGGDDNDGRGHDNDEKARVKKKRKKRNRGRNGDKKARLELNRNMFERKNIRKIFEDENLDEETKVAQKEEMERKQRLLEIQEKLKQQALELRAQRERDLATQKLAAVSKSANMAAAVNGDGDLTTMSLKSLLETGKKDVSEALAEADKPKEHDIVEISSSDEDENKEVNKEEDDDDDDLIIMSEEEEEEDDGGEDAENSGSHVNDLVNRPDCNGYVLVNVGHPPDEDDIFLAPQLASAVKPHQIGGIRFMYDNVVESLERFKTSNGFGCILAHSMGLGKTIQVVSFVDIFLRHTEAKSVLIIVPVNTLQNWVNEFNMWLPVVDEDGGSPFGCPYGGIDKDILWPREFKLYIINDNLKTTSSRTKIVAEWQRTGGALLLGYEMYRLLIKTRGIPPKSRRATKKASISSEPVVIDVDEEEVNKEIIKNLHEALVRPGPDLVICDEGHRIKNSHASISQVLKNIRTRRRIVLTGYPLQNNLLEYWCMVDFVRPNYLGSKQEFCNMFERPIMNGQCADSTAKDAKLMRFRAHVLHSLLEGFVQRRGHAVLQSALPQKEEYVLFVRLSSIQRRLYNDFMAAIKDSGNLSCWSNTNNPIKAFSVCCKIWNHPDILYQVVEQRRDDNDLDLDEAKGDGQTGLARRSNNRRLPASRASAVSMNGASQSTRGFIGANDDSNKTADDAADDKDAKTAPSTPIGLLAATDRRESQAINYDWAIDTMKDYQAGLAEHSGKMVILLDIITESVRVGDKILAFSQSLYTLTLIEEYLSHRRVPGTDEFWQKNRNYYRLDGGTAGIEREKLINQFNDYNNTRVHLFLLSTRAGCLGINLIGACRVVIFDASWNPCHDCQAVCRVYRYGQIKCCSVYRLVSDNTMEKNIYDRQINKQGISDRVVDEMNPQNLLAKKQVDVLMRSDETDPPEISVEGYEDRCSDSILLKIINNNKHWLTKVPFTHESLLLDRKDQKLTRREKKLAKQGYEMEKKMALMGIRQSSLYGKSIDGVSMLRLGQRPVASVRPMLSSTLAGSSAVSRVGILNHRSANNNQFRAPGLKPGVSVQQIQTTTDIIIPGTNTISDSTSTPSSNKIPAGEKVLVIKTPKGVYIRTSQGKIFAVRTAPKLPATTTTTPSTATSASAMVAGMASTSAAANKGLSGGDDDDQVMQIDDDDDDVEEVACADNTASNSSEISNKEASSNVNGGKVATSSSQATTTTSSSDTALASSIRTTKSNTTTTTLTTTTTPTITTPTTTTTSLRKIADSPNTARFNKDVQTSRARTLPDESSRQHSTQSTATSTNNKFSNNYVDSSMMADGVRNSPNKKFSYNNSSPEVLGTASSKPLPIKPVIPMLNKNNSDSYSNSLEFSGANKSHRSSKKSKEKEAKAVPQSTSASSLCNSDSQFNNSKSVSQSQQVANHNNSSAPSQQQQVQQSGKSNNFMEWNKKPQPSFPSSASSVDFNIPPQQATPASQYDAGLFSNYFKSSNDMPQHQGTFNNNQSSSRSFPSKPSNQSSFPSHHLSSPSLHHPMPPPSYLPPGMNPYGMPNPYSWISNPMWMPSSDNPYGGPFNSDYPPSNIPPPSSSSLSDFNAFPGASSDGLGGSQDPSCFPPNPFGGPFEDRSFSSLLMSNDDDKRLNNNSNSSNSGTTPTYRQNPSSSYGAPMMPAYPYHPNPYAPYNLPPPIPPKHSGYYNQAGGSSNHLHSSSSALSPSRSNYFPPHYQSTQSGSSFMQPYDFPARNPSQTPKKDG